MKILLVCAGGMSTSIIMRKMEKWCKEKGIELKIDAVGLSKYEEVYKDYECILAGPQVSYQLNNMKKNVNIPVAAIPPKDYAFANVESIIKLASSLIEE